MDPRYIRSAMQRLLGPACFFLLALAATGCPRAPDAPEPGMGTECIQFADCNPGVTCGVLRLCVEGFCEAEGSGSLIRACPGAGDPVRPPEP